MKDENQSECTVVLFAARVRKVRVKNMYLYLLLTKSKFLMHIKFKNPTTWAILNKRTGAYIVQMNIHKSDVGISTIICVLSIFDARFFLLMNFWLADNTFLCQSVWCRLRCFCCCYYCCYWWWWCFENNKRDGKRTQWENEWSVPYTYIKWYVYLYIWLDVKKYEEANQVEQSTDISNQIFSIFSLFYLKNKYFTYTFELRLK